MICPHCEEEINTLMRETIHIIAATNDPGPPPTSIVCLICPSCFKPIKIPSIY